MAAFNMMVIGAQSVKKSMIKIKMGDVILKIVMIGLMVNVLYVLEDIENKMINVLKLLKSL
jgi:hypothetical protein